MAAYLIAKNLRTKVRNMGFLGTLLYLKQCSVCLMSVYGGSTRVELSCPVSLTGSGYPRIIPPFHRRKIYRKDATADSLVRFYLTVFALGRIIPCAKPVSKSTFESIVTPLSEDVMSRVLGLLGEVKPHLKNLVLRYIPWVTTIPLNQGIRWKPVWSSLPNLKLWRMIVQGTPKADQPKSFKRGIVTPYPVISFELGAFGSLLQTIHSLGQQWSSGILWPKRVRYAFDEMNKVWSGVDLDDFEKTSGPLIPTREQFHPGVQPHLSLGRLAQQVQGGGKRRVFAIGNYVNQRLLRPLHDWLMSILRTIPMDGTFNQLKPLDELVGCKACYSFDLKAATDRWPLVFMFEIVQCLFDRSFASATVNSALAYNLFDVGFVTKKKAVSFIAGQPLGYYSSWPLFALSHHILIWIAADRVYPGAYFDKYAVLGDDVVITDSAVAIEYRKLIETMGIEISINKSLISNEGAGEFGKRFRVKGLEVDLSPVSSKLLLSSKQLFGLLSLGRTYNLSEKVCFRLGGAGYKQMATYLYKRSRKWERFHLLYSMSSGNQNISTVIGGGRPLNPDLFRLTYNTMINKVKPKQIKIPPVDIFSNPKELDFAEYSLLRNQVEEWLCHLKWYVLAVSCLDRELEELLSGPVVAVHWHSTKTEEIWSRFGSIWTCYDMVTKQGRSWTSPSLVASEGSIEARQIVRYANQIAYTPIWSSYWGLVLIRQDPQRNFNRCIMHMTANLQPPHFKDLPFVVLSLLVVVYVALVVAAKTYHLRRSQRSNQV